MRKNLSTHHYVDDAKLYEAMVQYKLKLKENESKGLDKPRVSEYIGSCILLIAKRLSTRPQFINYSYRDEMIGDGVVNCINYIDNFNHEKYKKPFAYFTQIIYYAFIHRIQKEKKHLYVRQKTLQNAYLNGLLNDYQESDGDSYGTVIDLDSDYMANLVEDFEKKLAAKKQKAKSKEADIFEIAEQANNSVGKIKGQDDPFRLANKAITGHIKE